VFVPPIIAVYSSDSLEVCAFLLRFFPPSNLEILRLSFVVRPSIGCLLIVRPMEYQRYVDMFVVVEFPVGREAQGSFASKFKSKNSPRNRQGVAK